MYNPKLNNIPDIAPLLSPSKSKNYLLPIYGDDRPVYQGLPPFIADSLPDSWGNTLFDKWVKENKIPRNKVTPLYKLMFIGTRGMGALEYEPYADDLNHTRKIDIKALYDISLKILEDRGNMVLNNDEELTLQALLAVGTSAGGRQMKAIIAINNETGEIRSGQTDGLDGFDYYILKFGDKSMPIAEIETTYYNIAVAAGIAMEECRLLPVEGINHFLTKRFDRVNGKKIHMQTLAAINPEARSYEDLVATCRELSISESEIEQLFCRMAYNVMTNNTDDHNKNFAFLLEENGKWRLAPAYDMTFIFNTNGTGPNIERRLSIGGKTSEITKSDLLDFAKQNGIKNANAMITRVADAIKYFNTYATEYGITQPWRSIIQKTLNENLKDY
jgi:serine/threonine-protein kinase HipA